MNHKPVTRPVLPAIAVLALVSMARAATFQGTVLDAYTRQPVPHAEVYVFDLDITTTTGEQGEFGITTSRDAVSLEVSRVGYRMRTWHDLSLTKPIRLYLLPEAISLDGVTVSAYRTPVAVDKSGPVTVLERKEAGRGGNTDLAAAVRTTPSAFGRDNVNFTSVLLRGTNASHTMIAIDGVRLNSAQNGTFDLTTLPLTLARRIEIARGGNSALYGSSPVGGLVNIITPEPGRLSANLRAGLGSFGRKHIQLSHTNWYQPVGYLVAANFSSTDNRFDYQDSTAATRTMSNADFENKGILAKGLFRTGPHNFTLIGEYNITERGAPGSLVWPSDSARRDDHRGIAQLAYAFQPSENLRTAARAFYHQFWQNFRDPAAFVPMSDTHNLNNTGIQLDQSLHFAPWGMAMAGLDASEEELTSTSVGYPNRLTIAGWAQARVDYSGFTLNPVVRYERLSQQHITDSTEARSTLGVFSPKATLTWSGLEWASIYAGVGKSFRAPTFNDLYWPEDMFSYGNPHLKPEWSTNFDIGIRGSKPDFLCYWIGYYHSSLTDLIQWQPDTMFRYHPINIDSATISGLELELNLDLGYAGLAGNLDLSRAQSGGARLYYRPELVGRATLWAQHTFGPVAAHISLTGEHTGNRLTDPTFPDTVPEIMPGYSLFHVEASVSPTIGPLVVTPRFGIRNLFDQRYQTVKDYPVPGRTWYAELEFGI